MVGAPTIAAQALQHARRYVGGRRINHRVVIGEWNVAEKLAIIIAIKSAPSTITVLHAEQPLNAAANSTFHTLFVRELDPLQGHQDERRVVHVGIIVIAEFKRPAARFGVFVFYLP